MRVAYPRGPGGERDARWIVNHNSMSSKHMMIMMLCCLIPLAGFFLVSVFGLSLSSLGTIALVLLCPLLHILMMRGMGGRHSEGQPSCHETKSEPAPATLSEPAPTTPGKNGVGNPSQPQEQRPVAR